MYLKSNPANFKKQKGKKFHELFLWKNKICSRVSSLILDVNTYCSFEAVCSSEGKNRTVWFASHRRKMETVDKSSLYELIKLGLTTRNILIILVFGEGGELGSLGWGVIGHFRS